MKRNPCRAIVQEFAKTKGICSQCFSDRSVEGRCQCQRCIDRCKAKRQRNIKRYRAYCNNNYQKKRALLRKHAYIKEYAKKKLYKKVKNLDVIKHAVEKGHVI